MLIKGFIKLLKKYRDGNLPDQAKDTMDAWYHAVRKEPVEFHEKDEIKERIWSRVMNEREKTNIAKLPSQRTGKTQTFVWKVAAATVLLIGTVLYFSLNKTVSDSRIPVEALAEVTPEWVAVTNNGTGIKKVILPDSSLVELEPGATLRHPGTFQNDSRKVLLEGNGFFAVTKDSKRPFLVYSGAVLTRVLGTSFIIRNISETKGTEVSVLTGKVTVEKRRSKEKIPGKTDTDSRIVLTPNKKVTFFDDSDLYITGLVDNPVVIAQEEEYVKPGAFEFDETPLSEVLGKLEKAYGVQITLSNDEITECPITADLSLDNLYGKIEIIGAVLNAKYEITGNTILLSGGRCTPSKFDSTL